MKQRVVVIGNGMVGQRFLEQLAKRSDEFEVTAFCEEPRPAYDRVRADQLLLGQDRRRPEPRADELLQGNQGDAAPERRACSRSTAEARSCARRATRRCRTTSWCSPPAPIPFVPPVAGPRPAATASSTAPSRISKRSRECGSALQARRGDRRRPARPRSREGAAGPGPRDARRRVRAAPDGGAGGRGRRRAAAHAASRRWASPCTPARTRRRSSTARRHGTAWHFADGTHARDRHDRVLGRHPPARRAGARRAAWRSGARGGIAIDDDCRTSRPEHLRHRRVRAVERPRLRPRGAGLPDGAQSRRAHLLGEPRRSVRRRRHEHQAQADGRGRGHRSATRTAPRRQRARYSVHRRAQAGLQEARRRPNAASSCSARVLVGDASDYGTLLQIVLNAHARCRSTPRS